MIGTIVNTFMMVCGAVTVLQVASLAALGVISNRLGSRPRAGTRPTAIDRLVNDREAPSISVILPSYNEAEVIVDTVRSALGQTYANLEVVVVNDGSTDDTVEVVIEAFSMELLSLRPGAGPLPSEPVRAIYRSTVDARIVLVDKEPSGAKADASNAGINASASPYVVVMDGDEFMEEDVIARCMAEVVAAPDEVVAVGATLLPSNDIVIEGSRIVERRASTGYWPGCQLVEYLVAFVLARPALAELGVLHLVSGGFGLFSRDTVIACGGYRQGHLGEDMDLCLRIHRLHRERGEPYRIAHVPEAIVWTELPPDATTLRRQRIRWHRGLRQVIADHRQMIGRRRYGRVGLLGVGWLYIAEWLGPILEGLGWLVLIGLVIANNGVIVPAAAVFLVAQILSLAISVLAVAMASARLEALSALSDLRRLLMFAVAFHWGYRQRTLVWRLRSLFPGESGWGEMPRTGLTVTATSP